MIKTLYFFMLDWSHLLDLNAWVLCLMGGTKKLGTAYPDFCGRTLRSNYYVGLEKLPDFILSIGKLTQIHVFSYFQPPKEKCCLICHPEAWEKCKDLGGLVAATLLLWNGKMAL